MPPKSGKTGQQTSKPGMRSDAANAEANFSTNDASSMDNASGGVAGAGMPTNSDILSEIRSLKQDITKQSADVMEAINGIKVDIESHARRIEEAEGRISQTEDDVTTLQQKAKRLEETIEMLSNKVQDQEDRARRSNVRLVGLPENTEGTDMCAFLEEWLPKTLGDTLTPAPVIERAHRVGQVNPSRSSTAPRTIIMKFLNYRDCEKTMRAARRLGEVRHENHRLGFFPDLSSETRQRQRQFDGVKARFRAMDIRYGMLYPAHLVITHESKRRIFKTVPEAEEYLRGMQSPARGSPRPES